MIECGDRVHDATKCEWGDWLLVKFATPSTDRGRGSGGRGGIWGRGRGRGRGTDYQNEDDDMDVQEEGDEDMERAQIHRKRGPGTGTEYFNELFTLEVMEPDSAVLGRGLFSKKASEVEKPTAGSELPHRLSLRPAAMSGGSTVRRSSASVTAENAAAGGAKAFSWAGQRVALGDVTNLVVRGGGRLGGAADPAPDAKFGSTKSLADVTKGKGGSLASLRNVNTERVSTRKATSGQFDWPVSHHDIVLQEENVFPSSMPCIVPAGVNSPGLSKDSASMEDAMSTCASMGSPDFECVDDGDSSMAASLHCWANDKLHISDCKDVICLFTVAAFTWKMHSSTKAENIFDIDNNQEDPQLCASLDDEIYKNLRMAETMRRPSPNFMDTTQIDMSTSMRAVLIDWIVEVIEEYRLVPETLYLTVNYIDRYLSVKAISRHRLQLVGIACLLIAAKYEEICAPQVEELCYLTDDSYTKDEVYDPGTTLHLEFIANYLCELSLLEYSLLRYVPSLIAASSVFLAKFIIMPTKNPWTSTLSYYTQYTPSELRGCVRVLHRLFCVGPGSNIPAVREKYSQHKYKFVAKKYCPPSIPDEFFQDATS
ncbi:hypothetical protein PR202_ga11627 [Eleusine coracana subsp. coracana]|uniref:Cyclin N-terminal domain-containing protein n=1 Tax=Eleusine coracana subsp. coracana TaxID=191504 RepID=A0AAV5CA07_ELECO|nr:hypothetical protein PR202_ga11627 [Eleusine coracana subsp. coracana]